MTPRMNLNESVFQNALGERPWPGTLNVRLPHQLPVREHFRILGRDLRHFAEDRREDEQDLALEICLVNGERAFRVRPVDLRDGRGGRGDDMAEIIGFRKLNVPGLDPGRIRLDFYR